MDTISHLTEKTFAMAVEKPGQTVIGFAVAEAEQFVEALERLAGVSSAKAAT